MSLTSLFVSRSRAAALLAVGIAALAAPVTVSAQPPAPPTAAPMAMEPANQPFPKRDKEGKIQPAFEKLHQSFLKRGKEGPIGVLFLGDSITAGWGKAPEVWNSHFGKYQPANFGIGGDRTQHVLWRIQQGELDGIKPKVVVLMIGTNNSGYPALDIARADFEIVSQIHEKLPNTKLLLLNIFPRGANPNDLKTAALRAKLQSVNAALAKLDDGNKTRYFALWDQFLEPDGTLSKDIMPDALHPNVKGYQIWADAMQPLLDEMMK